FEYGQGYVKSKFVFHGGTADQNPQTRIWKAMAESTVANPATGTPATSACRYEAAMVSYGIEQKQFTIYQTVKRTQDICLTDLLFKWQVEKHISAIMAMFSDITLGEWETFERDAYLSFCTKIWCMPGSPQFAAQMGADEIVIGNIDLNTVNLLSQDFLDALYQFLYRDAASGALSLDMGMPMFGLMTSPETSTEIIRQDSTRYTDQRYADPKFLLEGIGRVKEYQGWAHLHDPQGIRYKVSADGSKLIRVHPFTTSPTTIGEKVSVDMAYINAPFEISFVIAKNVLQVNVPPPNPASIGSANFDPIANFGDFDWMNFRDREMNPYGEIGFWMGRYRAAPEPMDNSDKVYAILHRRNIGHKVVLAAGNDTDPQSDAVAISSVAQVGMEDTYDRITVVLAESLACKLGATVTVANGEGTKKLATITGIAVGNVYELAFGAELDYVAWVNTGASAPTVTCGDTTGT
ncbi:MAG TPA: hypothetical protein PLZ55_06820, partial [bacterium]|nr:hypothetical protein [bacterium]